MELLCNEEIKLRRIKKLIEMIELVEYYLV